MKQSLYERKIFYPKNYFSLIEEDVRIYESVQNQNQFLYGPEILHFRHPAPDPGVLVRSGPSF